MAIRQVLWLAIAWALCAVPAAAQEQGGHAPDRPRIGPLANGLILVTWEQFFPDPSHFRIGWNVGRADSAGFPGQAQFMPPELNRGLTSVFTTPEHGGVIVMGQTGTFPGDRYGPEYRPVAIWVADVTKDGDVSAPRRLDAEASGEISDAQGWLSPSGEILLTWARRGQSWWISRSPEGAWSAKRPLGPRGFSVSALVRSASGSLVSAGIDRRSRYLVRTRNRTTVLGRLRSSGTGPRLATGPGGILAAWQADERAHAALLDRSGRRVREITLPGATFDPVQVGVDARGRGNILTTSSLPGAGILLRLTAVSPSGRVVRRQRFRGAATLLRPELTVDATGSARVVFEGGTPRRLQIADGSSAGPLAVRGPGLAVNPDASATAAAGGLIAWRDATSLHDGTIWAGRARDGRVESARVYSTQP
jgi:hypothetical protein